MWSLTSEIDEPASRKDSWYGGGERVWRSQEIDTLAMQFGKFMSNMPELAYQALYVGTAWMKRSRPLKRVNRLKKLNP